jgi:hypothetical protein
MAKTVKISDITHKRLQLTGTIGDTFDNAIKRLIDSYEDFNNIILQVKIKGNDLEVRLADSALNHWDSHHYDKFVKRMFAQNEWREELSKRIAKNNDWYNEIQFFKNQSTEARQK